MWVRGGGDSNASPLPDDFMARSFGTPANFASQFTVAIRITPTKVRGH